MNNSAAHNEDAIPGAPAPAPAEVERVLSTFSEILNVFASARGGQADLHGLLAAVFPSQDNPIAGPAAARSVGPAFNDQAAATSSIARRNTCTITGPIAGPAAVSALRPHLPTATLSVARPSAAEKGNGRAPPNDRPKPPSLQMRQGIDPQVEVIEISSDEEEDGPSAGMQALTPLSLSTAPPSLAGSTTASITLPRQPTMAISVSRATATEKGKGQAPPGDKPPTLALRKHQRVAPRVVEAIEISSDEEGDGPNTSKIASSSIQGALPNIESSFKPRGYDMLYNPFDFICGSSLDQRNSMSKIRDRSGNKVTTQRILFVIGPFLSCHFDLFIIIYHYAFRCELVPSGISPRDFMLKLANMEGFMHWSPPASNMDFICNYSHAFGYLDLNIPRRLGLMGESKTMALAPRLCYFLVTMCNLQVDRLTGSILNKLFEKITGKSLESLWIVAGTGIRQMTNSAICDMVKRWVKDICLFIAKDDGMMCSCNMATECNDAYADEGVLMLTLTA
ncbi:hypothetical protein GGI17_004360 [Coemansia sp. S146]|nr:hypothetical protein GGI17_004360 [Coemansia sp. S146]